MAPSRAPTDLAGSPDSCRQGSAGAESPIAAAAAAALVIDAADAPPL